MKNLFKYFLMGSSILSKIEEKNEKKLPQFL